MTAAPDASHPRPPKPPSPLWYLLLLAVAVYAWAATYYRLEDGTLLVALYDHLAAVVIAAMGVPAVVGVGRVGLSKAARWLRGRRTP